MKRRRSRRDIVIELTSLLDVIMIIIFMVMKENSNMIVAKAEEISAVQTENSQQSDIIAELEGQLAEISEKLNEAEGKLGEGSREELLQKLQAAESKLASYEAVDDVVIVLNIGLENKYNNTVRCLTYGKAAYGEPNEITENHSDDEFGVSLNKMRVFVGEYIQRVVNDKDNQTIVYVVFTYDAYKVYERDYEAVGEALEEAEKQAQNGNFRYRINPV